MKTTEQADATAHALDLLPPADPARSDPALRRNPELAAEVRATRELAADVWLAVAPLRPAPPGVLAGVLEKIQPPTGPQAANRDHWLPWLAGAGWAAAAAVALAWWAWPKAGNSPDRSGMAVSAGAATGDPEKTAAPQPGPRAGRDAVLRQEIQRLQARLAGRRSDPAAEAATPRVTALHAPGGARRNPEETRSRVNALLTEALRSALEAERASSNDPVELVIERGWLSGGLVPSDADGLVRHRNFPEQAWMELGLLRSAAGEYYDPDNGLIWSPDPAGRGFLGRPPTPADDLAAFAAEAAPDEGTGRGLAVASPEGFLIEDPLAGTSQVLLDQLPPQTADTVTMVAWTTDDGPHSANLTTLLASDGLVPTSTGTMVLALPGSGAVTSFQVLAVPTQPNSGPARVIIASDAQ